MSSAIPWWFDRLLLPLLNILLAFGACTIVLWIAGVDVLAGVQVMLQGALGSKEGISYTLYYATNFIFSGLGVALAWHAGLFNIGGEGQATMGGVGVAIVCLYFDNLPLFILMPLSLLTAASFAALWAFIPGWLNAYRGSHVVITTIMFNLIASSLLVYLLAGPLKAPQQMATVSQIFSELSWLPSMAELAQSFGLYLPNTPLNITFLWALVCCILLYIYLWRSGIGYETRVVGFSHQGANFAGIKRKKIVMITMAISGALIGFIGLNEIQGNSHQLHVEFVAGFGFAGIAIALMGRNHPLGIVIASILFGVLYQGGSELAFSVDNIGNDIIMLLQGLVVLFCGALQWMLRPSLLRWLNVKVRQADVVAVKEVNSG